MSAAWLSVLRREDVTGPPSSLQVLDCAVCPAFAAPSPLPITVGVVLIIGLAISYFFQFLSFFRLKSSKGMSSFSLGLALLSSLLTFINFLILHWTTIVCCACVSYSRCMTANLTPLQLFVNVLCLLFVYSAFLWYYPLEPFSIFRQQRAKEYMRARVLLAIVLLVSIVFSATSATLYYGLNLSTKTLATFGRAIGILSAIVVVCQWTPQIFTTFQLGSAGSLSVVMLVIQLPGCLLTVFFQAVIGGADITTWGPYLVSAINTMILIVMCGVFWIRNRNGVPEENFDILLSEDEHHVYEYDQDAGALARKSYGTLSFTPGPNAMHGQMATSSTHAGTPHSNKLAWSLSDRNGFKGKLSAATFITSGKKKRTEAHLSGKDLLGKSKPPDLFASGRDDGLDPHDMFARWNDGSNTSGEGTIQPPPAHYSATGAYYSSSRPGSQKMPRSPRGYRDEDSLPVIDESPAGSSKYLQSDTPHRPRSSKTRRKSVTSADERHAHFAPTSGRPSHSTTTDHSSTYSEASLAAGAITPRTETIDEELHFAVDQDFAYPPHSSHSSFRVASTSSSHPVSSHASFSSALAPHPVIASTPSSLTSKSLEKFGIITEIQESDADDIDFTEDPLNRDSRALDSPQITLDSPVPLDSDLEDLS